MGRGALWAGGFLAGVCAEAGAVAGGGVEGPVIADAVPQRMAVVMPKEAAASGGMISARAVLDIRGRGAGCAPATEVTLALTVG